MFQTSSERTDYMAKNPKGPVQQEKPDLPKSPKQPYGEPLSGNHEHKIKQQKRQTKSAGKSM